MSGSRSRTFDAERRPVLRNRPRIARAGSACRRPTSGTRRTPSLTDTLPHRAVAPDFERRQRPGRQRPTTSRTSSSAFCTACPFDRGDHVVRAQPGPLGLACPAATSCTSAPCSGPTPERAPHRWRQRGQAHVRVSAGNGPALAQLRQHGFTWSIGMAKPMLDRLRADGRRDADDFAARVDERPAAVAEADGRVRLDVGLQALVEQLAAEETHDADGHRMHVHAEGIPDGAHPLPDPQRVRVAERRDRQGIARVHLQKRNVNRRIRPDHLGAERPSVDERDRHAVSARDDVMVRQDEAGGVDDEAAARALARPRRIVGRIAPARPRPVVAAGRRLDVDDRGVDARGDGGEIDACRGAGAARQRPALRGNVSGASTRGRSGGAVPRSIGGRVPATTSPIRKLTMAARPMNAPDWRVMTCPHSL